jgi:Mn2+/Fe2+ NRAMP family transporter
MADALSLRLFIALAVVHVPWGQAARGILIPQIQWNGGFLTTLVAILGTTISPYLFIWQSSTEAEEQRGAAFRRREAETLDAVY